MEIATPLPIQSPKSIDVKNVISVLEKPTAANDQHLDIFRQPRYLLHCTAVVVNFQTSMTWRKVIN